METTPTFSLIGVQITRSSVEKLISLYDYYMDTTAFKLKKIAGAGTQVMSTQQVDYNTIITRRNQLFSLLLSGRLVWYHYHQVHIAKITLRQLETPKCAERTERHFRRLICRSTIGQVGFKICARRFHCFSRNLPIAAVSMFVKSSNLYFGWYQKKLYVVMTTW